MNIAGYVALIFIGLFLLSDVLELCQHIFLSENMESLETSTGFPSGTLLALTALALLSHIAAFIAVRRCQKINTDTYPIQELVKARKLIIFAVVPNVLFFALAHLGHTYIQSFMYITILAYLGTHLKSFKRVIDSPKA
jgi:hypothetical protein